MNVKSEFAYTWSFVLERPLAEDLYFSTLWSLNEWLSYNALPRIFSEIDLRIRGLTLKEAFHAVLIVIQGVDVLGNAYEWEVGK